LRGLFEPIEEYLAQDALKRFVLDIGTLYWPYLYGTLLRSAPPAPGTQVEPPQISIDAALKCGRMATEGTVPPFIRRTALDAVAEQIYQCSRQSVIRASQVRVWLT